MQSGQSDQLPGNQPLPGPQQMAGQAAQAVQNLQNSMGGQPGMPGMPNQPRQPAPQMMPGQLPPQYPFMPPVMMMGPMQNVPYMGQMASPMPMMYSVVPQQPMHSGVPPHLQTPPTPQTPPQPTRTPSAAPAGLPAQQPLSSPALPGIPPPAAAPEPASLHPLQPKAAPALATDEKKIRKLRKKARILEKELHTKMALCIGYYDEQMKLSEILNRITSENQSLLTMIHKLEPDAEGAAPAQISPLTEADTELFAMVAAGTHVG